MVCQPNTPADSEDGRVSRDRQETSRWGWTTGVCSHIASPVPSSVYRWIFDIFLMLDFHARFRLCRPNKMEKSGVAAARRVALCSRTTALRPRRRAKIAHGRCVQRCRTVRQRLDILSPRAFGRPDFLIRRVVCPRREATPCSQRCDSLGSTSLATQRASWRTPTGVGGTCVDPPGPVRSDGQTVPMGGEVRQSYLCHKPTEF